MAIKKKAIVIATVFTTLFTFVGCKKKEATTKTTVKPNPTTEKITTNRPSTTKVNPTTKEAVKSYKVIFITNGGSPISTLICEEGSAINKPNDPEKEGYVFEGWYIDEDFNDEFDFQSMPNHDINVYAKWELADITITFDTLGGSTIDPITQKYNSLVEAPEAPTKDGYTFSGWYIDKNFNEEYTFDRMPSKDITLYAKYTVNTYTLSFETFGGTVIDYQIINYGNNIYLPSNPIKEGCSFVGWYLDMELTEPLDFNRMPARDVTLYAKYEAKVNSISFISNGGTNVDTIIQDAGTPVSEPDNPTRFGYIFKGWYTESGLINKYTFSTMPADGIVLYAKWEIINYTVVYHANDGINSVYNPTTVNVSNNSRAIKLYPATKQHYDFVGWYTTSDFKPGTKIYNDEIPAMTEEVLEMYNSDKELHLYAKYKYHEYKITYVTYGAINTNPQTSNIGNEAITLIAPQRDNFVFVGWFTDESFETEIAEIPAHLDHDITIYAKYDYESFTVTYNYYDQYGVIPSDAPTNPNPTSINIDSNFNLANPSKAGYTFKGWYSSNTFLDEYKVTKVESGHTTGITLYALFERITYTITYKNSESFSNPLTYTVEDNISLLDGEKLGYDFDGWYIGSTKYTMIESGTTGNLTFTPKYNIITYNITFVTEGGSSVDSMTYNVESDFKLPTSTPDDSELKFIYWKNGNEAIKEIKPGRVGDLTLTAYYSSGEYTVTYKNYDGTQLAMISVGKNDEPVYPYDNPVKLYTDLCIYNFTGWDYETLDSGDLIATAEFAEVQYLTFTKNGDGSAYTVKATPNVILPENLILPTEYTVDGETLPVMGIDANGFRNGNANVKTQNVKKLVIPDGYTTIGNNAFYNCVSLEEITLPKSLTTIGTGVFQYARKLQVINYNCENLTNLTYGYSLFYQCAQDTTDGAIINIGSDVVRISDYVFYSNNSNLSNQLKVKEINFDGDKCKEIGNYAFCYVNMKDLVLPDHIEVLGQYAFAYCYNLETAYLPYNLKTNGYYLLYGCNKLRELTIPYIGVRTNGVLNTSYRYLGNIFYPNSSTSANSSYIPSNLKKVTITNETVIPNQAFQYAQYVEEITLNEEITTINSNAFFGTNNLKQLNYNCKNVNDLTGLSNVFYQAAYNSKELNITFGKNVEHIPAYLFGIQTNYDLQYYPHITSFTFDSECKIKTIGAYAFYNLKYIEEFSIPECVESIGSYAFAYSNIKTIHLGKMESINSSYGFAYMSKLENIYVDKITKSFGSYLFYNDNAIKNVYYNGTIVDWMNNTYVDDYSNPMYYAKYFYRKVGSTYEKVSVLDLSSMDLEVIKKGLFKGFETVTKIILPNTVKRIEDYAFSGMYRLNNINLPSRLEYIGSYAFENCYSLKSLTVPNSVETIGSYAFYNCANLTSLTLPSGLDYLPEGLFSGCSKLASVTLPNNLETLPENLFYGMTSLKSITLPNNLKKIDDYAFAYSGITSISIPKSVTQIDSNAFRYCQDLKTVTFSDDSPLTEIPSYCFSECISLETVNLPSQIYRISDNAFSFCKKLKNFDFDNIEYIGGSAFQYCGFEDLDLPEGVIIIEYSAFNYCTNIRRLTLPESLRYMGSSAFYHLDNLEEINWNCITLPNRYDYYYDRKNPSYYNNYYNSNSGIFDYAGVEADGVILTLGSNVEVLPYYFMASWNNDYSPKITSVDFSNATKLRLLTNYENSYVYDWTNFYSYAFSYANNLREIDIPGVEMIPAYFMEYAKNVETIRLNEGTVYLDYDAFYYMGDVTNVYIPKSLERVNSYVFSGTHITNLYYNGSLEQFNEIRYNNSSENLRKYADNFYYMKNGEYVLYDEVEPIIDENDILDLYETYYNYTFTDENPLVIPANIKYVKNYFSNTTFENKNIYYEGSLEDWCKIKFETGVLYNAEHFFYKEGGVYVELKDDLVIPSSITKLNTYVFSGAKNITTLDLNNVTILENYIFSGAQNLETINFRNVEKIGNSAFNGCNKLVNIEASSELRTIGEYAFSSCYEMREFDFGDSLVTISNYAFAGCSKLESITLPETTKKIYAYAFTGCSSLKEINLNEGLELLGSSVFASGCYIEKMFIPGSIKNLSSDALNGIYIEELVIGEGMQSIAENAFSTFRSGYLKKLTLPGSLKVVSKYLCDGANNLEEVILTEGIEEIGYEAFEYCYKLKNVTIPSSVTVIGDYAFNRDSLIKFTFTDISTLRSIGRYAFCGCYGIETFTMPSNLEYLGEDAFCDCYGLRYIKIDGKFNTVPYYLCNGCRGLNEVEFGSNIQYIASYAFGECYNLPSITINNNIKEIQSYAFKGCDKLFIVYNDSSLEIVKGETSNGYVAYYAKNVISSGESYDLLENNGFVFEYDTLSDTYYLISYMGSAREITLPNKLVLPNGSERDYEIAVNAFQYNSNITKVTIPDSFTKIQAYMFQYCKNLKEVVVGSGVTAIEKYAFQYSGIEKIIIPDNVLTLGENLFYECRNLSNVSIGSGINTLPQNTFYYCTSLETIVIPNTITSLGNGVFWGSGVKNITLSSGITELPQNTFNSCMNLESISLPSNIVTLGNGCFGYCKKLKSVEILGNIEELPTECFYECDGLESFVVPNSVVTLGSSCFAYCDNLASVTFGNNLETVGMNCFYLDSKLETVTFNSNLKEIGDYGFYSCQKLENYTLNNGLETIGRYAFQYTAKKNVVIPNSVTELGEGAYTNCYSLETIKLSSSITEIPNELFYNCNYLESIDFNGANIESIGRSAFYCCRLLENVILPDTVLSIDAYAFEYCTALQAINLDEVTSIGSNAFEGCSSLNNIVLNDYLERIGDYTFSGCSSLESIILPEALKYIGYSAFSYCEKISEIVIPEFVKTISNNAFYYTNLSEIVIPDGVETVGSYAFGYCKALTDISLGKGINNLDYRAFYGCTNLENVYYNVAFSSNYYEGSSLFYGLNGKNLKITIGKDVEVLAQYLFAGSYRNNNNYAKIESITIEEGSKLTNIGAYAFYYNLSEFDLVLPSCCKTIGEYAFYYSHIKSIEVENAETIGQYAFYSATELESAKVNGVINQNAFAYCTKLKTIDFNNATEIGYNAFYSSGIEEIVIPEACKTIGNTAFQGSQNLKKVTISTDIESTYTNYYSAPFYSCNGIEEVIFSDGVTMVPNYLFYNYNSNMSSLRKVSFASSIKTIGDYSFYYCNKIEELNLPADLTTIGTYAFYNCARIDNLTIPENVETIGNYAFGGCSSLYFVRNKSSLSILAGNSSYGYVAYYAIEVVNGDDDSTMFVYDSKYVFFKSNNVYYLVKYVGDSSITEVTLPTPGDESFYDPTDGLDEVIKDYQIRNYAFDGNKTLKKVTIPSGVKIINQYAFSMMENLEEITIGKDINNIGTGAFAECKKLKTINYNATNVTTQNSNIFTYAGRDTEDGVTVNIGSNVTSIPSYLFYSGSANYNKITTVNFASESSLTEIRQYAFYYCQDLKSITIPDSVTTIGQYAFEYCFSLENVTLSNNLTNINTCLFYDCTSLKGITIPNSVTRIYSSAFAYCTSLEEIEIPENVTQIDNSAFYQCTKLTSVDLNEGLLSIGENCFYNCSNLAEIIIPNTVATINNSAFYNCKNLTSVTLPQSLTAINSNLFYECNELESIIIPDTVTSIGYAAFYNCYKLAEVRFPAQLKKINGYSFYNCYRLESASLGGAIDTIDYYAFYGCSGLKDVTVSSPKISIGNYAFYNCNNMEEFNFDGDITSLGEYAFGYCRKLKELTIGDILTSIPQYAFYYAGLESVIVPDTVTTIGAYAFYNCSSLTNIELSDSITVLNNYVLYGSGIEELYIPEGVTTINNNAISYLPSLKVLSLPSTLESVSNVYFDFNDLEEVHLGYYNKDMIFTSKKISTVYVTDEDVAEYLLYDGIFGSLMKNVVELYLETNLTVTDYITDNYSSGGTLTIDGITYNKYYRF